jgi:sugar phosphate permease
MFSIMFPFSFLTLLVGSIDYRLLIAIVALLVLAASCSSFFFTIIAQRFNKWGMSATVAGIQNTFAAFGIVAANGFLTWMGDSFGWLSALISVIALIGVSVLLTGIALPMWRKFKKKHQL